MIFLKNFLLVKFTTQVFMGVVRIFKRAMVPMAMTVFMRLFILTKAMCMHMIMTMLVFGKM